MAPGGRSKDFDSQELEKDGLITGSVRDLLTDMHSPNLQADLKKGVCEVLDKLVNSKQDKRGFDPARTLMSVEGWPMPHKNDLSLVSPVKSRQRHRAGSESSSQDFGEVPVQGLAKSPMVDGIHILVCSVFFVDVFWK